MPSSTEQALKRLDAALRALEGAVEQRVTRASGAEGLADEVRMLTADRARLAEDLDHSQARIARLESVNREASRRIGAAVETIGAALQVPIQKP